MILKPRKLLLSTMIIALAGCGHSVKKATVSDNASLEDLKQEVEKNMNTAYNNHAYLLAPNYYEKGYELNTEIDEELSEEEPDAKEVREDAAFAISYFNEATELAKKRYSTRARLVRARHDALKAGIRDYPGLNRQLKENDYDIRELVGDTSTSMTPEEFDKFHEKYQTLWVKTVQANEIGSARDFLRKAASLDADDEAPKTYRATKKAIKEAENMIASYTAQPTQYAKSVTDAYQKSFLLYDVMKVIKTRKGDVAEDVALEIVYKDRKLEKVKARNTDLAWHLDVATMTIDSLDEALINKEADVTALESQMALQSFAKKVRNEFANDDLDVLIKDDNLIVRMKNIPFKVGRSYVPKDARREITRMGEMLKSFYPSEVTVVGHTDTTGSLKVNKKLSRDRARNVAGILDGVLKDSKLTTKAVAYKNPVEANVSETGRAKNRRVDLIIKN